MKKISLILLACLCLSACGRKPQTTTQTTPQNTTSTTPPHTQTTTTPPGYETPAGAINVVEQWGIKAGEGYATDNSIQLVTKFLEIENGCTVYFPEGVYELNAPVVLNQKKDIKILGNGAVFVRTGVINTAAKQAVSTDPLWPEQLRPLTASSSVFITTECENIRFEGLTIKYDIPTSLSGKITDKSGGTITVELTDGSVVTGNEYVMMVNSFTQEGIVSRLFEQYAATNFPVEKISENKIKVSGLSAGGVSNMPLGTLVCMRLSTASDYVFDVSKTSDIAFENITIHNSLNGAIILGSRCKNAYLHNVTVKPENEKNLMSTNADILHISALEGTLTVLDCHFEKPGDDCINVHNMAYVINGIDDNRASITAPRFSFSKNWGKAGDVIEFFDDTTFASLGTATIVSANSNIYEFDSIPAGVIQGTVISNQTMLPDVIIRNTTVMNNRARGFLLQTDNVTVEGCTFRNTALAAILIAPDLDQWFEMSPARNVQIRNNTFVNCGSSSTGTIQLSTNHSDPSIRYASYIHSDITITGNTFTSKNVPALFGVCVENLSFTDNSFVNYSGRCASLTYCNKVTLDEGMTDKCRLIDVTELNEQ